MRTCKRTHIIEERERDREREKRENEWRKGIP